ncbi:MAG: lipid-A-disaccharide synthase [Methylobacterium mesophilicum]|nr:lipid-A-disaccharide synthase [Methylobacterium mesophilicum]
MSESARPLRIGVVSGEESGDILAAELVEELARRSGRAVELVGVGGRHLQRLGLETLFDPHEIALVGIGAAIAGLPRILRRIDFTAKSLARAELDALLTVDVPDFSLRVAKRFRAARPDVPVVHYVCPSVWAWRPGRAKTMAAFVDHVLCHLPFEPAELRRLDGPPGTYVGHRLTHDAGLAEIRAKREVRSETERKTLLLLPGSRRSEVRRLLPDFERAVEILAGRGGVPDLVLPTVPHVLPLVEEATARWRHRPRVAIEPADKHEAMMRADAALIASGTISLELAVAGIPHVSSYRLDAISRPFRFLIQSWSANLPNLIADRPVIAEFFDETIRPANLARQVEALWDETDLRAWQLAGFAEVRRRLETETPAAEIGAGVLLDLLKR